MTIGAANAELLVTVGGGFGMYKPKLKSSIIMTGGGDGANHVSPTSGKLTANDKGLELGKLDKNPLPLEGHIGALWNFGSDLSVKLGVGVLAGYSHRFRVTDYGAKAEVNEISILAEKGRWFVFPHLGLRADAGAIGILVRLGVQGEYERLNSSIFVSDPKIVKINNLIFSLRGDIDFLFPVAPCFAISAGVAGTYTPSMPSFSGMNEKDKAHALTAKEAYANKKQEVFNLGGSWSVLGKISAHFTFS